MPIPPLAFSVSMFALIVPAPPTMFPAKVISEMLSNASPMPPPTVKSRVVNVTLTFWLLAPAVTIARLAASASITVMLPNGPTPVLVKFNAAAAVFKAVPIPIPPPAMTVRILAVAVAPPTTFPAPVAIKVRLSAGSPMAAPIVRSAFVAVKLTV